MPLDRRTKWTPWPQISVALLTSSDGAHRHARALLSSASSFLRDFSDQCHPLDAPSEFHVASSQQNSRHILRGQTGTIVGIWQIFMATRLTASQRRCAFGATDNAINSSLASPLARR